MQPVVARAREALRRRRLEDREQARQDLAVRRDVQAEPKRVGLALLVLLLRAREAGEVVGHARGEVLDAQRRPLRRVAGRQREAHGQPEHGVAVLRVRVAVAVGQPHGDGDPIALHVLGDRRAAAASGVALKCRERRRRGACARRKPGHVADVRLHVAERCGPAPDRRSPVGSCSSAGSSRMLPRAWHDAVALSIRGRGSGIEGRAQRGAGGRVACAAACAADSTRPAAERVVSNCARMPCTSRHDSRRAALPSRNI